MRKFLFLCLVKLDLFFRIDERLAARGVDSWAHLMEQAEMSCWPGYDGEMFSDWARSF